MLNVEMLYDSHSRYEGASKVTFAKGVFTYG